MKLVSPLIVIMVFHFNIGAFAADRVLSEEFSVCVGKAEVSSVSLPECVNAEMKRQDKRLNDAYKELMSELGPERKTKLREAQRLWVKYRDANCDFYSGSDRKSINSNKCAAILTAERAAELEQLKEESTGSEASQSETAPDVEPEKKDGSKYKIRKFEKSYGSCETESRNCLSVTAIYPEIIGSPSKAATSSVNRFIREFALRNPFQEEKRPDSFEELMDELIREYRSTQAEYPTRWEIERHAEIIYNTSRIMSVSFSEYSYLGGAHPNSFTEYASFDMSSGEKIELTDILIEVYQPGLNKIAEKKFREQKELPPGQSLEKAGFWFENNKFSVNDNFAVTEKGLIFFYNPYEIAPYAAGPTELELSYEEFEHLVKREDGVLGEIGN